MGWTIIDKGRKLFRREFDRCITYGRLTPEARRGDILVSVTGTNWPLLLRLVDAEAEITRYRLVGTGWVIARDSVRSLKKGFGNLTKPEKGRAQTLASSIRSWDDQKEETFELI
jgi:hypothetical protein